MRILWMALSILLLAAAPAQSEVKVPKTWTLENSRAFFVKKTSVFDLPRGGQMVIYFSSSDIAYIQLPGQKAVVSTHWSAAVNALERPFAICLLFDNSTKGSHGWMGDWRCVAVPRFAATVSEQFKGDHFDLQQAGQTTLGSSPAAIDLLSKNGFPLIHYVVK